MISRGSQPARLSAFATMLTAAVLTATLLMGTPAIGAAQVAAEWNCIGTKNACFFYGTFNQGAYVFFPPGVADPDLSNNVYNKEKPSDAGFGQVVAGNMRSANNYHNSLAVVLCTGVNYTGVCRIIAPVDNWPTGDPFLLSVRSIRWGV